MVSFRILAAAFGLFACSAAFAADPLPRAKPEDVGLSNERLARISAVLKADIEAGRIPGAVIDRWLPDERHCAAGNLRVDPG